jgi:hypothetical protein
MESEDGASSSASQADPDPAVSSISDLANDLLGLSFEHLSSRDIGAAAAVCRPWRDSLGPCHTAWRVDGERRGLLWDTTAAALAKRAAHARGWKWLLAREMNLERRWKRPALRARVVGGGHRHWVPSILMEPHSRCLVTCSYDGTLRFWQDADTPMPRRFHTLPSTLGLQPHGGHGGVPEGFSSIALARTGGHGASLLAAGSELGNIHVWEVWRPEDEADAAAAEAARDDGWEEEGQLLPEGDVAGADGWAADPFVGQIAGGGAGAAAAIAALDAQLWDESDEEQEAAAAARFASRRREHFSAKVAQHMLCFAVL